MSKIIELNDNNFDAQINESNLVIVDFYAPWCGHCRTQNPILEDLAQELNDKIKIAKINVDENREKAAKYGINGIPAILFFKNNKLVAQKSGVHSKSDLKYLITKYS